MREAIFFAVARDAEFEVRIGLLRRAAGRAMMQRLFFRARLSLRNARRRVALRLAIADIANYSRSEEDQVVAKAAIRAMR